MNIEMTSFCLKVILQIWKRTRLKKSSVFCKQPYKTSGSKLFMIDQQRTTTTGCLLNDCQATLLRKYSNYSPALDFGIASVKKCEVFFLLHINRLVLHVLGSEQKYATFSKLVHFRRNEVLIENQSK
jgi:hypothetical protein